jgi:hypothetical protein
MLVSVATTYLESTGKSRQDADRLIAFGRRRCQNFLADSKAAIPTAFDLVKPEVFVGFLKGSEAKIQWLRARFHGRVNKVQTDEAQFKDVDLPLALIRYRPERGEASQLLLEDEDKSINCIHDHPEHSDSVYRVYPSTHKWASLTPSYFNSKGKLSPRRWLRTLSKSWTGLVSREQIYHEKGFASLSTVTVKRSSQLRMDTNEDCAFIFDDDFCIETSKMTCEGVDADIKECQWMTLKQSHLKILPPSLLLGHQLPERPVAAWLRTNLTGFGVWGSSPYVRSLRDSQSVSDLTRTVYSRIQEQTIPFIKMATMTLPWKSLTRLPFASAGSSKSSANLTREIESITKAINSELDSNPALRDVRLHTFTISGIATSDINHADENGANNERLKSPTTWECGGSLYHCLFKWYIPIEIRSLRDTQSQRYPEIPPNLRRKWRR